MELTILKNYLLNLGTTLIVSKTFLSIFTWNVHLNFPSTNVRSNLSPNKSNSSYRLWPSNMWIIGNPFVSELCIKFKVLLPHFLWPCIIPRFVNFLLKAWSLSRDADTEWGLLDCGYSSLMNASEVHVDFSSDSVTLWAHVNLVAGKRTCNILTHAAVQACLFWLSWTLCFLTQAQNIAFIFIKCHFLNSTHHFTLSRSFWILILSSPLLVISLGSLSAADLIIGLLYLYGSQW